MSNFQSSMRDIGATGEASHVRIVTQLLSAIEAAADKLIHASKEYQRRLLAFRAAEVSVLPEGNYFWYLMGLLAVIGIDLFSIGPSGEQWGASYFGEESVFRYLGRVIVPLMIFTLEMGVAYLISVTGAQAEQSSHARGKFRLARFGGFLLSFATAYAVMSAFIAAYSDVLTSDTSSLAMWAQLFLLLTLAFVCHSYVIWTGDYARDAMKSISGKNSRRIQSAALEDADNDLRAATSALGRTFVAYVTELDVHARLGVPLTPGPFQADTWAILRDQFGAHPVLIATGDVAPKTTVRSAADAVLDADRAAKPYAPAPPADREQVRPVAREPGADRGSPGQAPNGASPGWTPGAADHLQ